MRKSGNSISNPTEPVKKSKTNPGLSYNAQGKVRFTAAPKKAAPRPRAYNADGTPFKWVTNQVMQSSAKLQRYLPSAPAKPVIKNTPAKAAVAAVKGVKKIAR
jgi:hypothetical protein